MRIKITERSMNLIDIHFLHTSPNSANLVERMAFEVTAIELLMELVELAKNYQGVPYFEGPLMPSIGKQGICVSLSFIFPIDSKMSSFVENVQKRYL